MVLRGLLDKKGACGQWRVRAFELTTSCLAYEEMRNGKRVRAEILLEVVGAVSIEGDDLVGRELVVTEAQVRRTHAGRAVAVDVPAFAGDLRHPSGARTSRR